MEQILRTLVQIPTISGNHATAKAALDYVAAYVARRGMHVTHYQSQGFGSLVATTQKDDFTPTIMLVAHVDIVPAEDHMFRLRVDDGKFFGRGVYDMKSGLAAFMLVIDALQYNLGDYSFGLMVTSDEEVGGNNGVKYLLEQGYRAQACVIPDGGDNWRIETFEKGVQWIKLVASGKTAHASRPWEGEHAVHKLLNALAAIRRHFPENVAREDTIVTVGVIQGGVAANQLAEHAEAMLDIRTGSHDDHRKVIPLVQAACDAHDVQAQVRVNDPPYRNTLDNPYIAPFKDVMVATTGQWNGTAYSYGVTDGRFFGAYDIPSVITMPPGGGWHGNDEWVSIAGCAQYVQIVQQYLTRVASLAASSKNE